MDVVQARAMGFDTSTEQHLGCSMCTPVVFAGRPAHEAGCPNATAQCEQCGETIARPRLRCDNCAGIVEPWE